MQLRCFRVMGAAQKACMTLCQAARGRLVPIHLAGRGGKMRRSGRGFGVACEGSARPGVVEAGRGAWGVRARGGRFGAVAAPDDRRRGEGREDLRRGWGALAQVGGAFEGQRRSDKRERALAVPRGRWRGGWGGPEGCGSAPRQRPAVVTKPVLFDQNCIKA